jgi:hypothetical protein
MYLQRADGDYRMRFWDIIDRILVGEPSIPERETTQKKNWWVPAIEAHLTWKQRLLDALDGSESKLPNPLIIGLDDHCELGQWLHNEGEYQFGIRSAVPPGCRELSVL